MDDQALSFRRVVVIGGGCYGTWYVTQLAKAHAAGAIRMEQVVVVDRNDDCMTALRQHAGEFSAIPLEVRRAEWNDYLAEWLGDGEVHVQRDALARDALVPSPLMPHVCLDWLVARSARRWQHRHVEVTPLDRAPRIPWERAAPDGRHYVSFAEWLCPTNCVEPALCPATGGPRSWSMPPAITRYVEAVNASNDDAALPLRGPVIFHCEHRTHGVGMINARSIASADAQIAEWGATTPIRVLVGTVSHCHGALGVLTVS